MKICSRCKQEKPDDQFSKKSARKDGLQAYCKDCSRERKMEWREGNSDKIREYNRRWRENNRDKINERNRRWRAALEKQEG